MDVFVGGDWPNSKADLVNVGAVFVVIGGIMFAFDSLATCDDVLNIDACGWDDERDETIDVDTEETGEVGITSNKVLE